MFNEMKSVHVQYYCMNQICYKHLKRQLERKIPEIHACTDPEGGQAVGTPSEKSQAAISILRNTGTDPHREAGPAAS